MLKVTMTLKKETKNTFVYDNDDEGTPITQLYIKKTAYTDGAPAIITVRVETNG